MNARRRRRRERARRQRSPSPRPLAPAGELRETTNVGRRAYSRRQAAQTLGISVSTIDRRVVPAIDTVKTPWGQRLIPVDELERFVRKHIEPAAPMKPRRPAGRPRSLPDSVVDRIRLDYERGRTLGEIARALTSEGVPRAHGGRRWWSSTVRSILLREAQKAE
jgi:hypothetical protein